MTKIDFFTKSEIETDIRRIEKILDCGIFSQENARHPLFQSAFIELVIRLRDLLYKSEALGKRIDFTEDVVVLEDKNGNKVVEDVTDAVAFVRNAACHIESDKNLLDKDRQIATIFNVAIGKTKLMKINDKELASDYEDDICFFYGEQKLYLKRHIVRAFEEAKKSLIKKIHEQEQ